MSDRACLDGSTPPVWIPSGNCVVCGLSADGYDAQREGPVCETCADLWRRVDR